MEVIELYILLAITTGITSCLVFLAPAISTAKEMGLENSFTENTWLSYLIYICLTTVLAPFSVLPIFIPSFGQRFKIGIERAVFESQT